MRTDLLPSKSIPELSCTTLDNKFAGLTKSRTDAGLLVGFVRQIYLLLSYFHCVMIVTDFWLLDRACFKGKKQWNGLKRNLHETITVVSRYFDTAGIRKKYHNIQAIELSSTNF